MEWGGNDEKHRMVAEKLGLKAEPPEIDALVAMHMEAFYSLSRARTNNGYGPLPLSITEISAWHRFMETPIEPEQMLFVTQQLDEAYMLRASKKRS